MNLSIVDKTLYPVLTGLIESFIPRDLNFTEMCQVIEQLFHHENPNNQDPDYKAFSFPANLNVLIEVDIDEAGETVKRTYFDGKPNGMSIFYENDQPDVIVLDANTKFGIGVIRPSMNPTFIFTTKVS